MIQLGFLHVFTSASLDPPRYFLFRQNYLLFILCSLKWLGIIFKHILQFFNENGKHAGYKISYNRVPAFLQEHMLITNKENKWRRDGSK